MTTPATPLFVKTHDFTVRLVNHTQRFPKSLRHSYTLKLETAAFEFEEAILMANAARGRERQGGRQAGGPDRGDLHAAVLDSSDDGLDAFGSADAKHLRAARAQMER